MYFQYGNHINIQIIYYEGILRCLLNEAGESIDFQFKSFEFHFYAKIGEYEGI